MVKSISGVAAHTNLVYPVTKKGGVHITGVLKKARKPLKAAKALGSVFRGTVSLAGQFKKLDKSLTIVSHVTKGPDLVFGVLAVKDAVQDVQKILDPSKKPIEKEKASGAFLIHLDKIANTVATVCKIVRASVGVGAERVVQWIPIFNIISFAVSFISLGLSAHSAHQSRKLLQAFNSALDDCLRTTNQAEKAKALSKALEVIEAEGIEPLRKQLMLSKKAKDDLIKRVDSLRSHIHEVAIQKPYPLRQPAEITKEDEELVRTLAGRAKLQLGFKVLDIASNIGGIVGTGVLFAPAPGAQIAGISVLLATSTMSLVTFGTQYFFINKNPFDKESRSRTMRMLNFVSDAVQSIKERLKVYGLANLRLPQLATAPG